MPAKKNPVPNLVRNKLSIELVSTIIKRFNAAAITAQVKNTFDGENLSEIVKTANKNVPAIKPNCTAEVKWANADGSKWKFLIKSDIMALPANHKEVQQNWARTIMGKIYVLIGIKVFVCG